jgi:hypothetical protein
MADRARGILFAAEGLQISPSMRERPAMTTKDEKPDLVAIRNYLIPGLWGFGEGGRECDLVVNDTSDEILLRVDGVSHRLLSRKDIVDGNYKRDFAPRVERILSGKSS